MMKKKIFLSIILLIPASCSESDGGGGGARRRSVSQVSNNSSSPGQANSGAAANTGSTGEVINPANVKIPEDPAELATQLQAREAQLQSETAELQKLNKINEALCSKLNEIKSQCGGKKPITSDAWVEQLNCQGKMEKSQVIGKVEVSISSDSGGSFRLRINDTYESALLTGGTTELTFDSLVDDNAVTPTFGDVNRVDLIPVSLSLGGKDTATVSVEVIADGMTLFNSTVNGLKVDEAKTVGLVDLYNELISPRCQMTRDELNAYIRDSAGGGDPGPVGGSPFVSAESSGFSAEPAGKSGPDQTDMAQKFVEVQQKLAALNPEVEGARNREFKLKNEILGGTGIGCHLKQPVTTLTLVVDGKKIREDVSKGSEKQKKGSGNSETLDINLGGFGFSATNFVGRITPSDDFSEFNLGSIDRITLTKNGIKYDNVSEPCNKSGGVFGEISKVFYNDTCYDIFEEDVMVINSLTLLVNEITLLQESNLNIVLNRDLQEWKFPEFKSNPKWGEMLQNTNCEIVQ